jgi:hypothetical protein
MRALYFFFILFSFFSCTKPEGKKEEPLQTADEFLVNAGGNSTDLLNDMFVNNNGNIYLTGMTRYYQMGDTLYFGNKLVTTFGGEDAIITKYDRYGNASWTRLIASIGSDAGEAVTADDQNNCYVAGTFGGEIYFGSTILTPEVISNQSGLPNHLDMFLAKYDAEGKEIWIKQISGPGYERPTSLLIDKAGNLLVTGYFYKDAKFGATTLNTVGPSFFLAKYTGNGSLLWAKSYGNSVNGDLYPCNLKSDNNGNLIITGSFDGPQIIGSYSIQSNGGQDVFTAKLDNNGIVQWVKTFGGVSDENCNALAIDKANNIYIGGMFKQSISIGGSTIMSTGNSSDAFFAKLLPTGTLQWIKNASGTGEENVQDMFIQKDTLYSVGYFDQGFRIENHVVNANTWNAFITKHDLAGGFCGLEVINLNNGIPKKIHVNGRGYSTIAGYFSNSISFENLSVNSWGGFDLFLLKKKLTFKQ